MRKNLSEWSIRLLNSPRAIGFFLISLLITDPILAQNSLAFSQSTEPKQSVTQAEAINLGESEEPNQLIEGLNTALRIYEQQPNPETWAASWQNFKSLVWHFIVKDGNSQAIGKSIPSLNQLGVKLTIGNNVKIWNFPRVADCQQVLVEWKETTYAKAQAVSSGKRGHRRIVKALPPKVVTKIQSAPCPANTQIDDALMIYPTNQSGGATLVMTGVSRRTGLTWLAAYRLSEGNWLPNSEVFSQIPPYLAQNLQGKATFVGTNLVLTVEEAKTNAAQPNENVSASQSGGYKITFRLVDMHYVLDNRLSADLSGDPPASIAVQFAQSVQKGRMDLVKAWLVDAQLASIPGYLALYNRGTAASPFKLVRMSTQGTGSTRFRLITFAKNDLILDIGKIKGQWLIKGLFIAPADPLAKTLAGIVAAE